jgi:heme/copper-type cytochrome/quinol oxidase subunit 2
MVLPGAAMAKAIALQEIAKAISLRQQDTVKRIDVSAERFAFTPSEITVERGTTLEFHLTSEDTDHGFRIVGTEVDVEIPKRRRGETVVRYKADTAGRFVIECSRPCGAGHTAMRAVLIVKEAGSREPGTGNRESGARGK